MSLKIRIIATLLYNGRTLVKGKSFAADRPVGHPLQAINVFQMREVDEIIFLDVTATKEGRRPDFALIESLARECFVPLTVGGGVKSVDDVQDLLRAGADKVSIRNALNPPSEGSKLMEAIASHFGRQVLVACDDVLLIEEDGPQHPAFWAHSAPIEVVLRYAGEVLIQCQDADGTQQGYTMDILRWSCNYFGGKPSQVVTSLPKGWVQVEQGDGPGIPVIASGGCGTYEHMAQAIDAGASAVVAGAMWLFTSATPKLAKEFLHDRGYPVRIV